jgi:NADPH2:quinone reductase
VEAEYDLARFANAVEHLERENRNGAILLASD